MKKGTDGNFRLPTYVHLYLTLKELYFLILT
jgi:hypothetical protein